MIDKKWIGEALPEAKLRIEAGRVAFFAKAIGERADKFAAVAPPTFLFSAYTDNNIFWDLLDRMGIPHQRLLHGEQDFEYLTPIHIGDEISVRGRIAAIRDKKDGALEFVEIQSEASNQTGALVAKLKSLLVVRNPKSA